MLILRGSIIGNSRCSSRGELSWPSLVGDFTDVWNILIQQLCFHVPFLHQIWYALLSLDQLLNLGTVRWKFLENIFICYLILLKYCLILKNFLIVEYGRAFFIFVKTKIVCFLNLQNFFSMNSLLFALWLIFFILLIFSLNWYFLRFFGINVLFWLKAVRWWVKWFIFWKLRTLIWKVLNE